MGAYWPRAPTGHRRDKTWIQCSVRLIRASSATLLWSKGPITLASVPAFSSWISSSLIHHAMRMALAVSPAPAWSTKRTANSCTGVKRFGAAGPTTDIASAMATERATTTTPARPCLTRAARFPAAITPGTWTSRSGTISRPTVTWNSITCVWIKQAWSFPVWFSTSTRSTPMATS